MNRYEIIEKIFKKFDINVDGEAVWNIIIDTVNANGYSDGYHNVEIGKFGDSRKLFFAEIEIKTNYDEDEDIYTTDIKLLSISSDTVVYVQDIEV